MKITTFFLEGDRFVGKSTLIKQKVLASNQTASGFHVLRRMTETREITGFELRSVTDWFDDEKAFQLKDEHLFLSFDSGKKIRDLTVFDQFGIELLTQAAACETELIILDEIGGIELLVDDFTELLFSLLKQPRKIIGVFKSEANYQRQKRNSPFALAVEERRNELRQLLLERGEIVQMTTENHECTAQKLEHFLF